MGKMSEWMGGSTKHWTITQETAVCAECNAKFQTCSMQSDAACCILSHEKKKQKHSLHKCIEQLLSIRQGFLITRKAVMDPYVQISP